MNENILNKEIMTRAMTDEELSILEDNNNQKIEVSFLEGICHFPKQDIAICCYEAKLYVPLIYRDYIIRTPTHVYIGRVEVTTSEDHLIELEDKHVAYVKLVRDGNYYAVEDFKSEIVYFSGNGIDNLDRMMSYYKNRQDNINYSVGYSDNIELFDRYKIPIPDYCMQDEDGKYFSIEDIKKQNEESYKKFIPLEGSDLC